MGEEDQKVQIFSYKINKSCVVMYSMETIVFFFLKRVSEYF